MSLIGYPSMAVDEDFLYLVNSVGFGHELVRLAKAGGSIEVLFKDETFPDDPIALSTSAIAVDDDFVYTETFGGTVGGGKIVGIPKEGGKPAQLIFHDGSAADDYNLINPVALATDNSEEASLYVLDYDRNAVLRIPKRGGKSTLVNQDPLSRSLDMVLDGDDLYVLQYNLDLGRTEVLRILRAGGPSQLVFGDEPAPYAYNGASRLAVDEVNLYVGHVNSQEIIAIPKESGEPAQVFFNRDSDLQDANMLIPARLIAGENALYVADPGLDAVLLIDKKTQKSAVFLGL
ncbi:MAG TPA: hypothetical protein DF383_06865 [Deltaproteobacteria bacterium]|nr:hypothetical protein [Deltaproteobacteria bacterium]